MKLKVTITGLLIGLLVGCSGTKQYNKVQSQAETAQSVAATPIHTPAPSPSSTFKGVSFPQATCGEKPPNKAQADTVKFYPVFIDYSKSNLQAVKSKYCRDAFKKFRKDKGKDVIQVASFITEKRANQFQEFLENKLGSVSAEVGEPKVIAVKPKGNVKPKDNTANNSTNIPISANSVGKAAKLTPEQVKELIAMAKRKAYKGLGSKQEVTAKFVVPTYLPPGFQVSKFSTRYYDKLGGRYEIVYCNSSKSCFLIAGGIPLPIGDEPIIYETTKEISSAALGKVVLGYTASARESNEPHIGFTGSLDNFGKDDNDYTFQSSVFSVPSKIISLQEAVKIVESLQYINF